MYYGTCEHFFKEHCKNHTASSRNKSKGKSTELSQYIWEFKNNSISCDLKWSITCKAHPYIQQNELDKACFQYDMTYGDFKDLPRRTSSGKLLSDKVFGIANNSQYDGSQRGVTPMVYKFLDKKSEREWNKKLLY